MKPIGVLCVFVMCVALGCNGKGEHKPATLLAIPGEDGTVLLFKVTATWACKPGVPCNKDTPPPPPPSPYYPCRCPNPSCFLCRPTGDMGRGDFEAMAREFGTTGVTVLPDDFRVLPPRPPSPNEGHGPGTPPKP